jgi:hypothetical protein
MIINCKLDCLLSYEEDNFKKVTNAILIPLKLSEAAFSIQVFVITCRR